MTTTLILGGSRSGKSWRAQKLAESSGFSPVYVATAEALDDEMAHRIARHRAERDSRWRTLEAPLNLAGALESVDKEMEIALVDCLTLWLSNLMHVGWDVETETRQLCKLLRQYEGNIILVSNEVGLGLVPETPLGRAFRDAQGRLNQAVAEVCNRVEFIAAGLPLRLKG